MGNALARFARLRGKRAVKQDAFVFAARQAGEKLAGAAAERGRKAVLQCGVRALQRFHREGDGVVFRLFLCKLVALLRECGFELGGVADGATAAGGVVEGTLRFTTAPCERVERSLQLRTGACGAHNWLVGNVTLRRAGGKQLAAQRQVARLARQGVQLGVFLQRGVEICANAGDVARGDEHEQLARGGIIQLLLCGGVGTRIAQGLL